MKRLLIDTNKEITFKNWIKQHDPKCKWDWDNPQNLARQFSMVIASTGDIDLKTIFEIMFSQNESGLSVSQNDRFLKEKY